MYTFIQIDKQISNILFTFMSIAYLLYIYNLFKSDYSNLLDC